MVGDGAACSEYIKGKDIWANPSLRTFDSIENDRWWVLDGYVQGRESPNTFISVDFDCRTGGI
ncbi:MAG: hypothetical protein FJ308_13415 [Planctomycetes bacterium]|nr:hypothetical protein [Planctomycetota bacterium]